MMMGGKASLRGGRRWRCGGKICGDEAGGGRNEEEGGVVAKSKVRREEGVKVTASMSKTGQ